MMISACAAKDGEIPRVIVRLADRQHLGGNIHFAHRWRQIERRETMRSWHSFEQVTNCIDADFAQHFLRFGICMRYVTHG